MSKTHDGFTLIELVVVLILIGISVALVAPTIAHSLGQAQFRKDIRSVSAMLTLARSQAITHKIPYAFSIDINERMIWINPYQQERGEPPKRITQSPLSHTDTLRVTAQTRENTSGTHTLMFYPNGSSGGGTIQMARSGQEETVKIKLNIVTGLATSTRSLN